MRKFLLTIVSAMLMALAANAEVDPDHRTAAPGIMVVPSAEPAVFVMRYLVYFTPREGNIYYRWMEHDEGEWSEWSECGKVVVFNTPGTYTVEAYAQRAGKPESAHLSTTFTVAYNGMSVAPGIRLQLDPERGYQISMTSLYALDIYYRWKMTGDDVWNKWRLYQEVLPFTEVGRYTIEARCDYEDGYDSVSVTFEVDRSQAGEGEQLPGDVNMDGKVDVADVAALVLYVLGNKPGAFNASVADLNHDNHIDVADVTELINLVLNRE